MLHDAFRVRESRTGHRVELCRNGEAYVTFMDGLTREGAEREVRALTVLWSRISAGRLDTLSGSEGDDTRAALSG